MQIVSAKKILPSVDHWKKIIKNIELQKAKNDLVCLVCDKELTTEICKALQLFVPEAINLYITTLQDNTIHWESGKHMAVDKTWNKKNEKSNALCW